MSTAQNLVDRALRLIGAIASGESPTTAESNDGLTALNAMISSWQTEKLYVYAFLDTAFSLVASDGSYTVGPAGNFVLTPRPTKIERCFVRVSDEDYPVELLTSEQWFAITDKTSTAEYPNRAYYEPTLTTGTLLVYPVPTNTDSLHIVTWTTLSELATLATTVTLPQGYERALAFNLAIEIAPEYGMAVSNEVKVVAQESKALIKRANYRPIMSHSAMGAAFGNSQANIITGDEW